MRAPFLRYLALLCIPLLLTLTLLPAADSEPLAGTRVSLTVEKKPLPEVLALLEKQAGFPLSAKTTRSPEITLSVQNEPLWKTLDILAAQAKLRLASTGSITLVDANSNRTPLTSYTGPFRVALKKLSTQHDFTLDNHTSLAVLELFWEPTLYPYYLTCKTQNVHITDEQQKVHTLQAETKQFQVNRHTNMEIDLPLPAVERSAKQLKQIAGTFTLIAAHKLHTFQFDKLTDPAARTQVQEKVKVTIEPTLTRSAWKVQVTLSYPPGGPEFGTHQTWLTRNQIVLTHKQATRPLLGQAVEKLTDSQAIITYLFEADKEKADLADWKITYITPAPLRELVIPFQLKDVPLP